MWSQASGRTSQVFRNAESIRRPSWRVREVEMGKLSTFSLGVVLNCELNVVSRWRIYKGVWAYVLSTTQRKNIENVGKGIERAKVRQIIYVHYEVQVLI